MKSKFFKDTEGLESAFDTCTPDKLNICLRLDKKAYEHLLREAQRLGITTGEYLERMLSHQAEKDRRLQ